MTRQERFESHVDWGACAAGETCWLWKGSTNEQGYGYFWSGEKVMRAHIASFGFFKDYNPQLCVLHHCDVPSCVNPEHLWQGTHKDNAQDKIRKNRTRNKRKFSEKQVHIVRSLHQNGVGCHSIARLFKCASGSIHQIVTRKSYKEIP